jgi:hypothetical protein
MVAGLWGRSALADPAPSLDPDTLTSLAAASARVSGCTMDCSGVLYFWSPRMPLSGEAIPHVIDAADRLGVDVTLVAFEELERFAETGELVGAPGHGSGGVPASDLAEGLLASGALAHAPSLVVSEEGRLVGPALLGYKSAEAYASLIADRLTAPTRAAVGAGPSKLDVMPSAPVAAATDFAAVGVPGAYFRWVPGRDALAYESDRRVYLLDLADGESRLGPGDIDFVPTPDGQYFVTPMPRNAGLGFYDADEVMEAVRLGTGGAVQPVFVDAAMRDQYPSMGVLDRTESGVRYRVMTSWFEGLRYRDYEVRHRSGSVAAMVRPIGDPIVPCAGTALSTPIMSQDGLEVAARDEASGTTKIYGILRDGRCDEVLALGMPTRKVAWHANGRRLAFSTPRVRSAAGGGAEPGIFIYDRDERRLTRVADSEGASQLAFPDFVGDDAVVFMVPGRSYGDPSYFRLVRPLP